jgi:soluble lytic murein transglycosylase
VPAYYWGALAQRRARNRRLIRKTAKDLKMPPQLLLAVAETESGFDDRAVSHKGAVGLMQVMPATGAAVANDLRLKSYDLSDPGDNVRIGATYLKKLMGRYRGDLHLSLAAYHAGPHRVAAWRRKAGRGHPGSVVIKRCAYKSTRKYVARVLAAQKRYARELAK